MKPVLVLSAALVSGLGSGPADALAEVAPVAAPAGAAAHASRAAQQPAAQARAVITGTVTDSASSQPLAGARVIIVGTQLGANTDDQGRFRIPNAPAGQLTLRATRIGHGPQSRQVTVAAGQTATADFRLAGSAVQLQALVSVGYGTQRREEVTGAVASVNVADVPVAVTQNVGQMLQGRVAGAQVVQNNGAPGGGLSIRVRGTNSIAANSEPLYVIDGVPAVTGTNSNDPYQNPLGAINPSDIENIEILKDASSTAIYGARGAAGVVLVTTKRGARGESRVTIESTYGVQQVSRTIPMLNATQFATMVNEARANAGQAPIYTDAQISALGVGTDWQDLVMQSAPQQSHTLGFTGGDERTRYLLSGSLYNQEGVVIGSDFDRVSGRINLERNVNDKLQVGTNLSLVRTSNRIQSSDNGLGNSTVMGALWFNPASPVRNEDGSYIMNSPVTWPIQNPVANTEGLDQRRTIFGTIGNIYGEYAFLDNLRFRTTLGVTTNFQRFRFFAPRTIPAGVSSNGSGSTNTSEAINLVNENTLNYQRDVMGNALDLLAGFTAQRSTTEELSAGNTQFANDILGYYGLGSGTLPTAGSGYADWSLLSWLGRANYNVGDKYLLSVTGRADGSSRFGANSKWGFFPSASVAWRAINEDFMQGQTLFSDLKLRLSYGVTGNQEIGLYNSLARLAGNNYAFGGTTAIGYAPAGAAPNPDLKWETTRQFNAGLDMGWLDDRISASIDAYSSTTDDLLLNVALPATSGYQTQLRNIGSVQNTGVELSLNTVNVTGGRFTWRSSLNVAANRNEVKDLGGVTEIPNTDDKGISGQTGGAVMVIRVGEPLGTFVGLRTNGIFQEGDECTLPVANRRATLDCVPGEYRYVDSNGDGRITSADRVILGDAQPDMYGGLTNDFSFGPLNLNVFLQGSFGGKVLNGPAINIKNVNTFSNQTTDALDRWTPTNTNTDVPRANANRPRELYDVHVEDATYIRLQSVTLGYNLPTSLIRGTQSARLYVTGQNLHVWTDYSGFDPEVNSFGGDPRARGIDLGGYPRSRAWNVGLNLTF